MYLLTCRIAVLALLTTAFGCSPDTDGFDYAPVSGTITLDGAPLSGATVAFVPQGTSLRLGRPSTGETDAAGRYRLESLGGVDGAVVGEHIVLITTQKIDDDTRRVLQKESLPSRYHNSSELTFTVEDYGTSEANFDLTSSKK